MPYHVVPASTVMKVSKFIEPNVGSTPPGHKTEAGHVTLYVPGVKINVKNPPFPEAGGFVIDKVVTFSVSKTVKTFDADKSNAKVPELLVGDVTVSQ